MNVASETFEKYFALAGFLSLTGLVIAGFTEATTNDSIVLMTFYFVFGLCLAKTR